MTRTDNAVGMEASLEAGMHKKNSTVEAIGRLEAAACQGQNDPPPFTWTVGVFPADLRLVLESLRHSVEREAAKDAAINTFCTHFIFAHDGSSDFSDLRREDFREAVADLARAVSPTPPSTGAEE